MLNEKAEVVIMADLAELERMITVLQDTEAIKRLKAKYWRCLDKKLWDEMNEVFAEDATVDYGYGPDHNLQGRKAIVQSFIDTLGPDTVITAHGGHSPEIEITSDTTAKGIWALQDYVLMGPDLKMVGFGHYEDDYVKIDGQWKKKSTRLTRIFEEWMMVKR